MDLPTRHHPAVTAATPGALSPEAEAPSPPADWPRSDMYGAYPLSGWWRRVGAALLDGLVFAPVWVAVLLLRAAAPGAVTSVLIILVYLIELFIYAPALMARSGAHNGQTLGKQWVGIRVLREDQRAMTAGKAFVREVLVKQLLFGIVAAVTLYIATLVNYLWPTWDGGKQALHDKMVKTRVVRT